MNRRRRTTRAWSRTSPGLLAVALILGAPASAAAITSQTFTDPVGGEPVAGMPPPDNCRTFTTPAGVFCGPDITQVVFSTPDDGNLHIDITYASLPPVFGFPQAVENVEVGLYPKTAVAPPNLFWDRRVSSTASGFSVNKPPTVFGAVTAVPRPLGIELLVPLAAIGGDPTQWRYVLNAGNVGEVVPEHAELVPNEGFIDLVAAPAAPPTPPQPPVGPAPPAAPQAPTPASLRAAIGRLGGIAPIQRGPALKGVLTLTEEADQLLVEALVRPAALRAPRSAPAKLTLIGRFSVRNLQAGRLRFRVPLAASVRAKLGTRPAAAVVLRITLRDGSVTGVRTKQVTWRRPVRNPA